MTTPMGISSATADPLSHSAMNGGNDPSPVATEPHAVDQRVMDALLNDKVLGSCNNQSLARLLPKVMQRSFQAGEEICKANHDADYFYLVLNGVVRLTSPQGQVIDISAGHFGEEAASDAAFFLCDAHSVSAVDVLCIPRAAMANLVEANPRLKTDLFFSMTGRFSGKELVRHAASEKKAAVAHTKLVDVIGWILTLACPLLILEFGEQWHLSSKAIMFSAIFSSTVIMWAFSLVDDYIPSLFALLVILVTG
ncbi:MAG: cyclic nucleotide-binding domain-containing protein, partial [Burkholderiaceae bacterium]